MESSYSPTSSSQSCNYEVFLSFRGEDTRKTFVDHLYSALVDRKIFTYKDDETLPRGESIGPYLLKAIEASQIGVIIFSENYANSSWCLEELAHIMKCKDERNLIVMPIFYGVVPSEVRKQQGNFGKGFCKQEEAGNINKVDVWRKALVGACDIAGWETENIANGHESKGIKEIVDTISDKLLSLSPGVNEELVGIKARLEELEAKLNIGSDGVQMVGIWGCGGSGKTTLATSMYMKISAHFQGHCIVDNIREKSSNHGLGTLQQQILSKVLNTKVEVQNVEQGKQMMRRLSHSNVLILLDDIDDYKQLDALAGSRNWFGSGSRIIITTRDEHILLSHKVDHVCPVRLLSHEESVKLFSENAYNEKMPIIGYEALSLRVVSYASGLPLALKVLGSFLYDKDENEWRGTLKRLEDTPETEILDQLKISYDGLKRVEKNLFLDIACFFRGESLDKVTEILEAFGYHPGIGIKVLTQKALINIVDGKLDMHDLIQEMGHNIVRSEHPKNPEEHSRVWKNEEIESMCVGDAPTENDKIEAIKYDGDPSLFCKIISNKKRLRWLSLTTSSDYEYKDVRNVEAPSFISNDLRYIYLEYYPESPFPDNFQPNKLVTLELVHSLQKSLWKGKKCLQCLKVLQLSFMENLLSTPDFDGLPCLRKLSLFECKKLKNIHPSLGNHAFLEDVIVVLCVKLRMFPTIVHMRKLKTLSISGCSNKLEFPKIESNMESLEELLLVDMGIDVLFSSSAEERFVNLVSLQLHRCYVKNNEANYYAFKHLKNFTLTRFSPSSMPTHHFIRWKIGNAFSARDKYRSAHLTWLPSVLSQSTHSLRRLNLNYSHLRDGEIPAHIGRLSSLIELDLSENDFTQLDFSLSQLTRLKRLDLSFCKQLVELPELPSSLAILEAESCKSLTTIGDFHKKCKWICKVSFVDSSIITDAHKLLHSVLQEKAIENHSMRLKFDGFAIAKEFTPPLFRGGEYRLKLADNWCNDFCGFLVCAAVTTDGFSNYEEIEMEHVMNGMNIEEDHVPWEEMESESDGYKYTCVYYVPFASLTNTSWWKSASGPTETSKAISIRYTLTDMPWSTLKASSCTCSGFGVRLVTRKSASGPTETSATREEESEYSHYAPKFKISHTPTTLTLGGFLFLKR